MEDKIKSFNAAIGYKQKNRSIKNKNNFTANYTNSNDFKKKNKLKLFI